MRPRSVALILALLAGIGFWFAAPAWLGFSLGDLPLALRTGAALGAKLGCTAQKISGLSAEQAGMDLESYSPVTAWLRFRDDGQRFEASLFGVTATTTWRPGVGCTPEPADARLLDAIRLAEVPVDEALPVRIDPSLQSLADRLLDRDNQEGLETRVLLVAHDGVITAEAYKPGITADTPLLGWSMGKSVTSMLVGRLETLGQPLPAAGPLFPEWTGDPRASIGLDHLLTMTSGLDWYENYVVGSDSLHMLFLDTAAKTRPLASSAGQTPGSHFYYSSGTTNLLMALMHRQLGGTEALYAFFDRELRQPLGLRGIVLEPDASGVPVGSSYVHAPGRDWARLGQLMLNRGTWQGQVLLSPAWIHRATSPNKSANDPRYGYQFWLNRGGPEPRWMGIPEDAYAMMGNRGQTVMMIPSKGLVIVRLGWNDGPYPIEDRFARLMDAASTSAASGLHPVGNPGAQAGGRRAEDLADA